MRRLIDIQAANAEVGRVRIGHQVKGTTQAGKEYTRPAKLETFRLTSHIKAVLEEAARVFGGTVEPWEGHTNQWQLITERTEIHGLVQGTSSLSQDWEQWVGGGWTHRCDGTTCTRRVGEDTEYTEPCSCDPDPMQRGKIVDKKQVGCKVHSRLSFMLTELNSTGKWMFSSTGKIFAQEILGHFLTCEALGLPDFLFVVLTLEQEEIKRPGKPADKFAVVRVAIDPAPPNFLGRIVKLVQSSQYVLPPSQAASALEAPKKQLAAPEPVKVERSPEVWEAFVRCVSARGFDAKTDANSQGMTQFKGHCAKRDLDFAAVFVWAHTSSPEGASWGDFIKMVDEFDPFEGQE
jgi:hypothetical protein